MTNSMNQSCSQLQLCVSWSADLDFLWFRFSIAFPLSKYLFKKNKDTRCMNNAAIELTNKKSCCFYVKRANSLPCVIVFWTTRAEERIEKALLPHSTEFLKDKASGGAFHDNILIRVFLSKTENKWVIIVPKHIPSSPPNW